MNEDDLFRAYSSLQTLHPSHRNRSEDEVIEDYRRVGYERCLVEGCITLIAIYADRKICRFHKRKLSTRSTDAEA